MQLHVIITIIFAYLIPEQVAGSVSASASFLFCTAVRLSLKLTLERSWDEQPEVTVSAPSFHVFFSTACEAVPITYT